MKLDLLDKKIIYHLDINSRMPATVIARKVRASKETVNFKIKNLIRHGYIRSLYPIVDSSVIGYSYYQTFIKLRRTTPEIEKRIIDFIAKDNQEKCINLRVCEGHYDIVILNVARSLEEMKEFIHRLKIMFGEYIDEKNIHSVYRIHKMNTRVLYSEGSARTSFIRPAADFKKPDRLDVKLMGILSGNSRVKLVNLSRTTGVDSKVVNYRLRRMEKNGIIVSHSCALNAEKIGMEPVQINISLKNPEKIMTVIQFFDQTDHCMFVYECIGKYELSVELYVENDFVLNYIIAKFKERFAGDYNYFDVAHMNREYTIGWSPFAVSGKNEKN